MNTSKHSALSYDLANDFETMRLSGEAASWEDLCVFTCVPGHSDYGIVVWGESTKNGERGISVSLRQNFNNETMGEKSVLFTAYAPWDAAYEGLMEATDKVLAHFERSATAPAEPLYVDYPYGHFSKEVMQPLLDALNNGDFQLAAELTPAKHRLCGYQEFTFDHLHEQYGHGWAGQFEHTLVPAGRYPVFVREYSRHEAKEMYTNQVKDFQGLSIFLAGKCIADSNNRASDAYPFDNTVWESPYCHTVAHAILENKSSIHLIPPFKAVPVHFQYDGEEHTTYKIVDQSLPEFMKENPMRLRNQQSYIYKTLGLSENARRIYDEFVRNYSFHAGHYGGCIPMNVLSRNQAYSPAVIQELLDIGLIQRRNCDGVAYELPAVERLHMFHTGQIAFAEKDSYILKGEYERCKKEAMEQKTPLAEQLNAASTRAAQARVEGSAKRALPER